MLGSLSRERWSGILIVCVALSSVRCGLALEPRFFRPAATADVGVSDVSSDASSADASVVDSSAPDASMPDASSPDASVVDASICPAGLTLCGEQCVDTASSADHCGACGRACPSVNGAPRCEGGVCRITCDPRFGNCDGNAENGCEAPLDSPRSCGACGATCTGATSQCSAGRCVGLCPAGTTMCGGACVDITSDALHCGACGRSCFLPNAMGSCRDSACSSSCLAGFRDCDRNAATGCESNVQFDRLNCGACGTVCDGTKVCVAGACVSPCAAGEVRCAGGCVNPLTDVQNCGRCGMACVATGTVNAACFGGMCRGCRQMSSLCTLARSENFGMCCSANCVGPCTTPL